MYFDPKIWPFFTKYWGNSLSLSPNLIVFILKFSSISTIIQNIPYFISQLLLLFDDIEKIENTNAAINNEKILENEYVIATFKNGSLYSYKLKNYYPQDLGADATNEIIDMVEQVYEGIYPFTVTFQNLSNSIAIPENLDYQLTEESDDKVSFSANAIIDGSEVKITKTFTFGEDPYQLKNSVSIENVGEKDLSLFYSYFLATGIGPYRTDKNAVREDATKAQYLIKGNGKSKILLTGDIVKDNILLLYYKCYCYNIYICYINIILLYYWYYICYWYNI